MKCLPVCLQSLDQCAMSPMSSAEEGALPLISKPEAFDSRDSVTNAGILLSHSEENSLPGVGMESRQLELLKLQTSGLSGIHPSSSSPYPFSHQILSVLPPNCLLDIVSPFYWHSSRYTAHYAHPPTGFPTSTVLLPLILHTSNQKVLSFSSDRGTHLLRKPQRLPFAYNTYNM